MLLEIEPAGLPLNGLEDQPATWSNATFALPGPCVAQKEDLDDDLDDDDFDGDFDDDFDDDFEEELDEDDDDFDDDDDDDFDDL